MITLFRSTSLALGMALPVSETEDQHSYASVIMECK